MVDDQELASVAKRATNAQPGILRAPYSQRSFNDDVEKNESHSYRAIDSGSHNDRSGERPATINSCVSASLQGHRCPHLWWPTSQTNASRIENNTGTVAGEADTAEPCPYSGGFASLISPHSVGNMGNEKHLAVSRRMLQSRRTSLGRGSQGGTQQLDNFGVVRKTLSDSSNQF